LFRKEATVMMNIRPHVNVGQLLGNSTINTHSVHSH
jgi:hypothetical protein